MLKKQGSAKLENRTISVRRCAIRGELWEIGVKDWGQKMQQGCLNEWNLVNDWDYKWAGWSLKCFSWRQKSWWPFNILKLFELWSTKATLSRLEHPFGSENWIFGKIFSRQDFWKLKIIENSRELASDRSQTQQCSFRIITAFSSRKEIDCMGWIFKRHKL